MPRIALKELETDKAQAVADLEATLGRDPTCGFVIEGAKSKVVSGRHARIFFQDSAWWIQDTSRNGTILDAERLQAGQRHALKVGQVIGLGESGPRLKVTELESREVTDTVLEPPNAPVIPKPTTAPRQPAVPSVRPAPKAAPEPAPAETAAMRRSEAVRAGVSFEESTEPMSPAPDWLVHAVVRATNLNQRFDVRSMVIKLGRSPECEIRVAPELGASVSRVHAEIAIWEGGVIIRDAGSRNGTYLNGKRIETPHQAAKGDVIMLGSGGPTFAIEDLHIVKGHGAAPAAHSAPSGSATPAPKGRPYREPPTAPAEHDVGTRVANSPANPTAGAAAGTALMANVLEDVSEKSAQKVRIVIWAAVGLLLLSAVVVLGIN